MTRKPRKPTAKPAASGLDKIAARRGITPHVAATLNTARGLSAASLSSMPEAVLKRAIGRLRYPDLPQLRTDFRRLHLKTDPAEGVLSQYSKVSRRIRALHHQERPDTVLGHRADGLQHRGLGLHRIDSCALGRQHLPHRGHGRFPLAGSSIMLMRAQTDLHGREIAKAARASAFAALRVCKYPAFSSTSVCARAAPLRSVASLSARITRQSSSRRALVLVDRDLLARKHKRRAREEITQAELNETDRARNPRDVQKQAIAAQPFGSARKAAHRQLT